MTELDSKIDTKEFELYKVRRDVELQKLVNANGEADAAKAIEERNWDEDEVMKEQMRRRREVYGLGERSVKDIIERGNQSNQ